MKVLFCTLIFLQIFITKAWGVDCGYSDKSLTELKYEPLGKIQGHMVFIHFTESASTNFPVVMVKTVFSNRFVKYQSLDCGFQGHVIHKASIVDDLIVLKSSVQDRYDSHTFNSTEKFKLNKDNNYKSISRITEDTYEEAAKSFRKALKNKDINLAIRNRDFILKTDRHSYNPVSNLGFNIDICLHSLDMGYELALDLFNKKLKSESKKIINELLGSPEAFTNGWDCLSVFDITVNDKILLQNLNNDAFKLKPTQIKKLNDYVQFSIKLNEIEQAQSYLKIILESDQKNLDAYKNIVEVSKKSNLKTFAILSGHIYSKLKGEPRIISSKELKIFANEMKITCLKDETLKATYTEFLSYPSIRVDCIKGETKRMQFYWNPIRGKKLDFTSCPATDVASEVKTNEWHQEFLNFLNISNLNNCHENSPYIQRSDCKWIVVCEGGVKASTKSNPEDETKDNVGLLDIVMVDEINDKIEILKETSATGFKYEVTNNRLTITEKIFFSDLESTQHDLELGHWSIDCTSKDCAISDYECRLPYLSFSTATLMYEDDWLSSFNLYTTLKSNILNEDFSKGQLFSYGDGLDFYKIDVGLMRSNQQSCLNKVM